jgi:hypothetical protein
LTHAVIGESRFYARRVRPAQYKLFCKKTEQLIKDNYFDVSLDNKLEFLVCSQICSYDTSLRKLIEQEVEKSVSWAGNFLVDTHNYFGGSKTRHCLRTSEHRNVLYLMSQKAFKQAKAGVSIAVKPKELPVIGRLARVRLSDYGIRRAIARVDSGATSSSIAASNIFIKDGELHFTLLHEDHPLYIGKEIIAKDFWTVNTRNATSEQERYAVMLNVGVDGGTYSTLFTLADRRNMLYPVLLGRNFLKGRYTVNTAKQFIEKIK